MLKIMALVEHTLGQQGNLTAGLAPSLGALWAAGHVALLTSKFGLRLAKPAQGGAG